MQALLQNWFLDATEVLAIIPDIQKMIKQKGTSYTASFVRHFGTRALLWGAYDTDNSESKPIQEFLAQVYLEYDKTYPKMLLLPTDNSTFQLLHVTITPTSAVFEGPFVGLLTLSNRILKHFLARYNFAQHFQRLHTIFSGLGITILLYASR